MFLRLYTKIDQSNNLCINICSNSYLHTVIMVNIILISKSEFLKKEVVLISVDEYNLNKTDMVKNEIRDMIKNIHSIAEYRVF